MIEGGNPLREILFATYLVWRLKGWRQGLLFETFGRIWFCSLDTCGCVQYL